MLIMRVFCGGAALRGSDGMASNTQLSVIKYAWVPVAMSYHARHSTPLSPKDPTSVALPGTESPLEQLPGARVHFEPGHAEDLPWANRW
jgi:hypothetical protein